jgi:class 3 adenylate cyclase
LPDPEPLVAAGRSGRLVRVTQATGLCPVQVGREREASAIASSLDILEREAKGQLVLIAGEAGVGKSRLAKEALGTAQERGFQLLLGHCAQDSSSAYAPFVTAVRRKIRRAGDDEVRRLFDGSAEMSAALFPEVARLVREPLQGNSPDDLFAAVWQLLFRLSRPTGSLFLLEDLHWADADSLKLLGYLARELSDLPILLLGTYRLDELHRRHPLHELLWDLGRSRLYVELHLSSLEREPLRQMLSAIFDGTDVGDEFVDAVLERTAGNPFFVEELSRALVDRGDVFRVGGDWERRDLDQIAMPATVRETLLERTRLLSPDALSLLRLAALADERLDLPVLAHAADVPLATAEVMIEEGLRAQLLAERHDELVNSYTFRHALTREALADEIVGPERHRAHARIANALVAVHRDDIDEVAGAIADHFAASGEVDETGAFALRAARNAIRKYAVDEADRRYDQALRLLVADDAHRLQVLLEAIDPTLHYDPSPLSVSFASEARALARTLDNPVAEATAIVALSSARWRAGDTSGAIGLLQEALSLVEGRDRYEEAAVLSRLSRLLHFAGNSDEARALVERGIEVAQSSGNMSALSGLYGTQMINGQFGSNIDDILEMATVAARKANDPLRELNAKTNAGYIYLWLGEFAKSGDALREARELSTRIAPSDQYATAGEGWLLSLLGRYEEARELARPLTDSSVVPTRIVALTALYEVAERCADPEAGRLADDLWSAAKATGESQRSVPALSARARQILLNEGLPDALPAFWAVLDATVTRAGTGSHWLFSPDLAAELARKEMDGELERWTSAIMSITDRDPSPHNRAATAFCQACSSMARGDLGSARTSFETAIDLYRSMPAPAREIESLMSLAECEGRTRDSESAAEAAAEALELARRIDAGRLIDKAEITLARLETQPTLVTVLFTDIVGSTRRAAELGDRRWRDLLAEHHTLVRHRLEHHRGTEIDTAGDGFLATFESPARAIRCALDICQAVKSIGLEIRAGLHTGEVQRMGSDIGGIAVHIGARVSASAGPSEVFVSRTVVDLVAGSGFEFEDRGEHDLKGVPGSWRLFSVTG